MKKRITASSKEASGKTPDGKDDYQQAGDPSAGSRVQQRRNLLKTISGGSVLAAGGLFPNEWARPVIQTVLLPAHAQTSPNGNGNGGNGTTTPSNGTTAGTTSGTTSGTTGNPTGSCNTVWFACEPSEDPVDECAEFSDGDCFANNITIAAEVSGLQAGDVLTVTGMHQGCSSCTGPATQTASGSTEIVVINTLGNSENNATITITESDGQMVNIVCGSISWFTSCV